MNNKKAFTLIELLVVVLIIVILAAIALPRYQRSVERARASDALSALRALAAAEEAYYLANNAYTDYTNLDISAPAGSQYWNYVTSLGTPSIYASRKNTSNPYILVYRLSKGKAANLGRIVCGDNQKICAELFNATEPDGAANRWIMER